MPRDARNDAPRSQWGRTPMAATCSDCGRPIPAGAFCTIHPLVTGDLVEHIATCADCTHLRALCASDDLDARSVESNTA